MTDFRCCPARRSMFIDVCPLFLVLAYITFNFPTLIRRDNHGDPSDTCLWYAYFSGEPKVLPISLTDPSTLIPSISDNIKNPDKSPYESALAPRAFSLHIERHTSFCARGSHYYESSCARYRAIKRPNRLPCCGRTFIPRGQSGG